MNPAAGELYNQIADDRDHAGMRLPNKDCLLYTSGETMSMDLTEPDAGSDLQSVMLKATYDEANNCWRLNGCLLYTSRCV